MKRLLALSSAVLTATLFCGVANAQEQTWLGDRQYREGPGWRVGDFELHPGIGADFGYDSNYYQRHADEAPIGSLRLRVSPHFSVATLGAQRTEDAAPPAVGFRFDVGATYNEFIPVSGGADQADQDGLRDERNIGGDAKISLDILPQRTWSGRIYAGVGRTVRPTNSGDVTVSFNRITPDAGAELIWTPGSGLLDWRLGYGFTGTFFESGDFSGNNNFRNDINTRLRWRFLPRTALMYDAHFGFVTYPTPSAANNKTDSHPLRTRVGLNGLVTPSFGVLALVGWGSSFYTNDDQDFDSVIGQAELKWYLTPTPDSDPMKVSSVLSAVSVGFIRDYEDSYIGTYLEKDMGYARFNYLFGGQFLLVAQVMAGAVVFPPQTNPDYGQAGGWTDFRMDGNLFGEWRVQDWLGINAQFDYTGYFSDTDLITDPATQTVGDKIGFQQFKIFGGIRAFL